jgi:hypothetical protein
MQDIKASVGQVPGFGGLEPSAPVLVSKFQTGTSSNFLELGRVLSLKKRRIGTELQPGSSEFFQNPNWGLRVWVEML